MGSDGAAARWNSAKGKGKGDDPCASRKTSAGKHPQHRAVR